MMSKRFGIAFIACTMALVMTFTAGYQLIFNIKQKHDLDVKTAINQEYTNKLKEQKAETEKQNEYNAQAQQAYSSPEPAVAVLTGAESSNTNDLEITDEQAFLYSLVFIDLLSFGYDVFPAVAVKQDQTEILGFGYTAYDDIYEKDTDNKIYFGSGFVSLLDQPEITDTDVQDGITINQITDETDQQNDYGFILSFEEQYGPIHYIAFEQYIKYSVQNFGINYTAVADDPSLYDVWGEEFGYLYNYDLGQPVYDPNLGAAFNPDGFSIYQGTDYNAALSLTQNMVFQQDENYLTVDTVNMFFISPQAIADYLANNQDEKFLGISADQLNYVEAMLDSTVVYYIDGSGQLQLAQIPPDPQHNIFRIIMSVAQIAIGGILLAVPGAQVAGAFMIAGGVCGLISEFFMDEIGQLFDAASTVMTGINCLMIGISLLSCNPFGVALGVTSIIVGGATTLVGLNDLGTVITGVNLIQAITGMSDSAYMWMKMGLTIASTVLTIVGSIYKAQYVKGQQARDARIGANTDKPDTLNDLRDMSNKTIAPGDKTEVHHIVEQCQVNKSGFTVTQIQDESNLITLRQDIHREISSIYSSKIPELTGGSNLTVRNWLAGQSFDEQTKFGYNIIKSVLEAFK